MNKVVDQIEAYLKWCDTYRNMTKSTLVGKRYNMYQIARETQITSFEEFDQSMLYRFVDYQRTVLGVSPRTVNKRIKDLRCIVKWLREEGLEIPLKITRIQLLKEDPPRRQYYTREEIYHVIALANEEDALMIRLMFEMALRITETITLTIQQIQGRSVTLVGKGRKAAILYMSAELSELLADYIERRDITHYLFSSPHQDCAGQNLSKAAARVRIIRAFERAGIYNAYPHSIRHSRATDLQRNGATNDLIRDFLRHESVSTTEVYMHYFSNKLQDQFDKFTVLPA